MKFPAWPPRRRRLRVRVARPLLALEWRRLGYRWLFLVFLLLYWFYAETEVLADHVLYWTASSVLIRDAAWLLGPLTAALAAGRAARDRRVGLADLLTTTPWPAGRRRLVIWAAPALCGIGVYLVCALYVWLRTALRVVWGGPDLSVIIAGLAAIPAAAAIGSVIGTAKPRRFVAGGVALGLLIVQLILQEPNSWFSFLSPVSEVSLSPWTGVQPALGAAPVIFFLAVTGFMLAWLMDQRRRLFPIAVMIGAVIVVILAVATIQDEADGTRAAALAADAIAGDGVSVDRHAPLPGSYALLCQADPIPVCFHPAYAPLLGDAATSFNQLFAPLTGVVLLPTRIDLVPHPDPAPPSGVLTLTLGTADPGRDLRFALFTTSGDLLRVNPTAAEQLTGEARYAGLVVQAWLLSQTSNPTHCQDDQFSLEDESGHIGFGPTPCDVLARFAALDPATRDTWFRANFVALRDGELRLEDLP